MFRPYSKITFSVAIPISIILVVLLSQSALAEMTASVYKIDSDSINNGGTENSFSTTYDVSDTVGEIAVGDSTSTIYSIGAGYRQMDEASVSIGVSLQNITLVPDLGGLTGGTSTGATQVTVTTDNPSGYSLSVQSSATPAMRSDLDTISDYQPLASDPDFRMRLVNGLSMFAFTPEGSDIVDRYRDDGGSICGVIGGFDSTNRCWDGISTTGKTIVNRTTRTLPAGATTTIRFSAGIGVGRLQVEGSYYATTTITALAI